MNSKIFIVFTALCAVLLAGQAACKEDGQTGELYILNPGSVFPVIVKDPESPILNSNDRQIIRICIASQCNALCRSFGFRIGRCNIQAICVCSR